MKLILSEAGLTRIVIPTVFREDYILALKALTNEGHAEPYVRMLTTAAKFSALLDYANTDRVLAQLAISNATKESHGARLNLLALLEPVAAQAQSSQELEDAPGRECNTRRQRR